MGSLSVLLVYGLVFATSLVTISTSVYRIFFHPLSRFPGSPWAAVSTLWYEWYWNIWRDGSLLFEIERLHALHGPIIRIGTNELHLNIPELYPQVFRQGSRFLKDRVFYDGAVTLPTGSIGQVDPTAHRVRRETLWPLFSPQSVKNMSPLLEAKVDRLFYRLDEISQDGGNSVNLTRAFKAYTLDTTAQLLFGTDWNVLDDPQFQHNHISALQEGLKAAWIPRIFPRVYKVLSSLPFHIRGWFLPPMMVELLSSCAKLIDEYSNDTKPATVLNSLLHPPKNFPVPSLHELNEEMMTLMVAGNDTTSNALILAAHRIGSNPKVVAKLREELRLARQAKEDSKISYDDYMKLPYLTAAIKEVLRETAPFPGRLPRVVPEGGLQWNNIFIPAGTTISISAYMLHRNQEIFKDALTFWPERWLGDSTELGSYLAAFSKGTRQCIGIHLAWYHLYLVLDTLFTKYEVALSDNAEKNLRWRDHVLLHFRGDLEAHLYLR